MSDSATSTYTTAAADQYIARHRSGLNRRRRLGFHLMGEVGWINDPNGFSYFGGEYHLFYQHYPYAAQWGPMHWGHAVSQDLVRWEHRPVALAPDRPYDRSGAFSGSAIERDGQLCLFYTGHIDEGGRIRQVQNLALSRDGIRFTKFPGNPVIDAAKLPPDASPSNFRDPKVIQHEGLYYMVVGSCDATGSGQLLLYRSQDLIHWEYLSTPIRSERRIGKMWECPDLFRIDGVDVLVLSPQYLPADGHRHNNLHASIYMLGEMDFAKGRFTMRSMDDLDGGFDFYAPQTMQAPDGRRLLIAWMNMWESPLPTQEDGWAGQMTLVREVWLQEDRLYTYPVRELERYRREEVVVPLQPVEGEVELEGVSGRQLDLEVTLEPGDAAQAGVRLLKGASEETVIGYDAAAGMLWFDRSRSGEGPGGVRRVPVALREGRLTLRILVDRISVEVFANGGERAMTGLVYPADGSDGVALFARGGTARIGLKKWAIEVE